MPADRKNRNKNLTIPNAMSVLRIIIIPFFAYFFLNNRLVTALVLLLLSGLTDLLDGMIARKFNQVTELGKLLDPVADKITQGMVAICMGIRIPSIRYVLILLIVKELLMLVCGCILLQKKKKPCAAQWFGKVSTTLFYISIAVILAMRLVFEVPPVIFEVVANVLLLVTAGFMLYSAIRYFLIFLEIMRSDSDEYAFDIKQEIKEKKEP